MKPLVYVAMSGGVDSSVAAALLAKGSFRVVGVYFKPWAPASGLAYCNWQQDRQDAMRVAATLGIDFKTWDFSKEYGKEVAQYMIDAYRAGSTPNPDVMCNKEIKFGLFLKKALAEGADYIATGHYAVTKKGKLYTAKDTNKDQTYFLWTLTHEQLSHTLFPIGGYTKPEVRKLAKKFGLPNHAKKDSQGVCFVGELDMQDFLQEYIKPEPGPIYFQDKIVGTHDGTAYYTIGQRHGLDISIGGGPYYVSRKEGNILFVEKTKVKSKIATIADVHWISKPLKSFEVKIRYRTKSVKARLQNKTLHFAKAVEAVTAGQSAVMYAGREVLGGAIIQSSPQV